jgi:hypothetical protein
MHLKMRVTFVAVQLMPLRAMDQFFESGAPL